MKKYAELFLIAIISSFATFFLMNQNNDSNSATAINDAKLTQLVKLTENEHLNTSPVDLIQNEIPTDFISPAKKVKNAVVNITSLNEYGRPMGNGSGVIYTSNGYIITNNHVVERGSAFEVKLTNNEKYKGTLIGRDRTTDLALIKINKSGLNPISIGNSDQIQVGEWVLAAGNPFNLSSTITAGIVSAKGRNLNIIEDSYSIESFIQTDAVVNPGNSGGALVNTNGELIGINTAILSRSGGFEGYSFAIPSNLAIKVIEDLKEFGEVKRAILGISIREVSSTQAERLGLPFVGGVYINEVSLGGSAQVFGLKRGDVIVGVENKKVRTVPELQEIIARYRPGDKVDLQYYRNGKPFYLDNVKLGEVSKISSFR